MKKLDLTTIFKTMPRFRDYLTHEKRQAFMNDDGGFIDDLQQWKDQSLALLIRTKEQLEEILDSDLMKEASKFAPWVKERWIGELAIVLELLDEVEKEVSS